MRLAETSHPSIAVIIPLKGRWRVSWQRVTAIGFLILGAVACAYLGKDNLATLFAGASAGAMIPGFPVEKDKRNGSN